MTEQQNIEYKQSWNDDYLKWIAAFANSRGGAIYIGKDDQGRVTGLCRQVKRSQFAGRKFPADFRGYETRGYADNISYKHLRICALICVNLREPYAIRS